MIWRCILFLPLLWTAGAWAFPDMVRHGYTHCTSCHTTLVGGNLLNEYGRSLSREALSQTSLFGRASAEGDEQFAHGLVKTPNWLLLGGDVRILQAFVESKTISHGRFLIMQVDIDASAQVSPHWRLFASIGRVRPTVADATAKDFVAFPRAGVEYLFTKPDAENRLALRVGRFMPAYGIFMPEHTLVNRGGSDMRSGLGFNPAQERYAAELAWNNDTASVLLTGINAQADGNDVRDEKGGTIQVATAVGDKSKVGLNFWHTDRVEDGFKYRREMLGAFAHIGFTKDWYGLLQVDRVTGILNPRGGEDKHGWVEIFKLGYEIHQGLQLMMFQEFANYDSSNTDPKFEAYSIGAQWFPRPHWDFFALYRRERNTALPAPQTTEFDDRVWLIAHFYL